MGDGEPLREQFFESCRAPLGALDELAQLRVAQALDEAELRQLRQGLRMGVDSGAWATRVLALEKDLAARAGRLLALQPEG